MTAGSSHNSGFGPKGSGRAPLAEPRAQSPASRAQADPPVDDADLEFDPTLPRLELDFEPALSGSAPTVGVDLPPTLAPETPLPRCLTEAAHASSRPASGASNIPPAPKLPRFSMPAGQAPPVKHDDRAPPTSRDAAASPADAAPSSETWLGLPTDRVLPGSPALVSTFRPKPQTRSGYSVTNTGQEERIYAPKRARKAKAKAKAKPPTNRRG